jgi:HK97 family phage major capsid protein
VAVHTAKEFKLNELPKEMRLFKACKAMSNGDSQTLTKLNEVSRELAQKSGYGNITTNEDGGYVVEPEFDMAVEKLLPNYGIASVEATIVPTNSNLIYSNKLDSGVEFYETAEAGNITGTKLDLSQNSVKLRKFMANAPYTSEIEEDSAVDFYNELVDSFARARAKKIDQLVFTDDHASYPGLFKKSGTIVEPVGTAATDITWDDLLNAEFAVPSEARVNGKHYMHRSIWNALLQNKDDYGRYQFNPSLTTSTPWGTPVILCDVLPSTSQVDTNDPFAVYGDLKRVKVYVKRGMTLDLLREGTVNDADGTSVNLALQDMKALRARMRAVALIKFPNAFDILGTGGVS